MLEDFSNNQNEIKVEEEETGDFPKLENIVRNLNPSQMEVVNNQYGTYEELSSADLSSELRDSLSTGNGYLPRGTYLHGTSLDNIESIAKHGIVSGELLGIPEDGETHLCADFFKVKSDMAITEYVDYISMPEEGLSIKAQTSESKRLPSRNGLNNSLAVILDPSIPEIEPLLANDPYKEGSDAMFDGIVDMNSLPVDKHSEKAQSRFASVLIGLPSSSIAGLILGSDLAQDSNAIDRIKSAFNNKIALYDTTGQVVSLPI
ncbi:MAG: hypothetical protein WCI37_01200 [bacterium]